jgi:hypothetical protein
MLLHLSPLFTYSPKMCCSTGSWTGSVGWKIMKRQALHLLSYGRLNDCVLWCFNVSDQRIFIPITYYNWAFVLHKINLFLILWSHSSVDGIATGYGFEWRRCRVPAPVGSRIFTSLYQTGCGSIQPPIHWVPRALSPGAKRQGREADHSPPTSAEVKKTWSYTSISA